MFRKRPEEVPRRVKCMPKTKLETLKKGKAKKTESKKRNSLIYCVEERPEIGGERERRTGRGTLTQTKLMQGGII